MISATGKKPIVIALKNLSETNEKDNREDAIEMASRLAGQKDEEYVVYIPIAIVAPKKDVTVTIIDGV